MKLIGIYSLIFTAVMLASCSKKTQETAKADPQSTQMVGNDKDSHGCIGSAGYTWSPLRNECIRVFEAGTRLDPQAAVADKTVSAFVVFAASGDDRKAEVFLPGESTPRNFAKQANNLHGDTGTWKGGDLTLRQANGKFILEDGKGTALYQNQ